jgi:hypothetical protein
MKLLATMWLGLYFVCSPKIDVHPTSAMKWSSRSGSSSLRSQTTRSLAPRHSKQQMQLPFRCWASREAGVGCTVLDRSKQVRRANQAVNVPSSRCNPFRCWASREAGAGCRVLDRSLEVRRASQAVNI